MENIIPFYKKIILLDKKKISSDMKQLTAILDIVIVSVALLLTGVIIHLEPDILEFEVRWALESSTMNKASGGDGIPVELFQP